MEENVRPSIGSCPMATLVFASKNEYTSKPADNVKGFFGFTKICDVQSVAAKIIELFFSFFSPAFYEIMKKCMLGKYKIGMRSFFIFRLCANA